MLEDKELIANSAYRVESNAVYILMYKQVHQYSAWIHYMHAVSIEQHYLTRLQF